MELLRSETAAEPPRLARALAGLRAYQEAERAPPLPVPGAIAELHGAQLRDYGGEGAPVLFVPSLINPPNVLDLSEDRSLLRWLAAQGHRVLLLDWGCDSIARRALSVAAHVEEIIIPMIGEMEEPPALVGYCLGGTMAVAAAAKVPARALATIAAPWHFAGFGEDACRLIDRIWAGSAELAQSLGVLPMEVLQCLFWNLDPGRTVRKFEAFAGMEPGSPEARSFVTLEDWANDGPPLPFAAAREMFDDFFSVDAPGRSQWSVAGMEVDPAKIDVPQLHIVSTTDRIVPKASAIACGSRLQLDQGHVGMVVGRHARPALWEPLSSWLRAF
jgi:polyhydroxyalkanoate synthase subunit PhaC